MRYFISDASCPLKYLFCGNLISKQEFLHHKRNFDMNVLILVKEGTLYINQDGRNYEVGGNQYIFLRAGKEHFGYQASTGKLSYLWVHFLINKEVTTLSNDFQMNSMLDKVMNDSHNSIYIIPEYGEISLTQRAPILFNQLLDLSRQDKIYSNQIIDYALSLLVMEISQEFIEMRYKTQNNIPPNVARIMEWIKGNYYKQITIADIGEVFGYNTDYLSFLFKKYTDITVINYINKTRIDIAKSLIVNYDISIKEAAYSCGFSDEKYFMKTFKKFENLTPSQYKKAFTKKMIN